MSEYDEAMAEAERLGLMSHGVATDRCQCAECGRVFSTDRNFARHRRNESCLDPAVIGLVRHPRGWWQEPAPDAHWSSRVDGRAEADREAAHAFERWAEQDRKENFSNRELNREPDPW